jgi:hypothetical protein
LTYKAHLNGQILSIGDVNSVCPETTLVHFGSSFSGPLRPPSLLGKT